MNDLWTKPDGTRWSKEEVIRIGRLFRQHVRTSYNPLGRIVRDPCWYCAKEAVAGNGPRLEYLPPGEFHHVDYSKPFLGAWLCHRHHRLIDHGALRLSKRALRDYSSLVIQRPGARREARTKRSEQAGGGGAPPF